MSFSFCRTAPGTALALILLAGVTSAEPPRWDIRKTDGGWQLLKDGKPFYIRGAVGSSRFELLRDCGGNAVRTRARRRIEFTTPEESGAYRLFVTIRDGKSHVAYGNVPFYVAGE